MRIEILAAFADFGKKKGLTAEQVADHCGMLIPGVNYWTRVSELKQRGLIAPKKDAKGKNVRAKNMSGSSTAQVYVITEKGTEVLQELKKRMQKKVAA
jgi:hypothetical protein